MSDGRLELPAGLAATLVLVRHGESTYVAEGRFQGRHDPGLSPLGERQARLVAQRLASRHERSPLPVPPGNPQGVWHSPLRRAAETARAIGAGLGETVALHAEERLTELAQGEWEGLLHSEVHQRWPLELAHWREDPLHFQAPGGEALGEAAGRVTDALEGMLRALAAGESRRPGSDTAGDVAEVRSQPVPGYPETASGDYTLEPWAIAVAHDGVFRLLLMRLLDLPLERFWSFPFSLCSITVVTLRDGVTGLRAHNLADHLAPLAADDVAAQEARGDRRGAL